jgi:hypothetical protein
LFHTTSRPQCTLNPTCNATTLPLHHCQYTASSCSSSCCHVTTVSAKQHLHILWTCQPAEMYLQSYDKPNQWQASTRSDAIQ